MKRHFDNAQELCKRVNRGGGNHLSPVSYRKYLYADVINNIVNKYIYKNKKKTT